MNGFLWQTGCMRIGIWSEGFLLPRDNHVYQLAPYETITKERYDEMKEKLGKIDFSRIVLFEKTDTTEVKKELACVAGV